MVKQADGSLSTTYSGTIVADITESSVAFVGGSAINANNSGNWQTGAAGVAGNAPANYGAYANAGLLGVGYAVLRSLLFDLKSGPITMLAGSFAADTLEFSFPESATFRVQGQIVGKVANATPSQIPPPVMTPGQIGFTIPTTPGRTYTILGSADLTTPLANWTLIDEFMAASSPEARAIAIRIAGQQFWILKEE